jgi:hypothetical protein
VAEVARELNIARRQLGRAAQGKVFKELAEAVAEAQKKSSGAAGRTSPSQGQKEALPIQAAVFGEGDASIHVNDTEVR